MQLDLKKDEQKIRRYIKRRVSDYPVYENLGPGDDEDPIQLITLGYCLEQAGYFAMVFDTRPDADNDGEWTLHIENDTNVLPLPRWLKAFEHLCDGGSVTVSLPGGGTHTLDDSDDNERVAGFFGEIIRDTMLSLRDKGALSELPLAPRAFFVVEEFEGQYGWPPYKRRKTLGRLRQK